MAYATIAARRTAAEVPFEHEGADQPIDPADDPEAALARRQDLHRLDRALAALPDDLRECLVLRELEELSYREIAEVTGVAMGTVMSRLWRARRAMLDTAR